MTHAELALTRVATGTPRAPATLRAAPAWLAAVVAAALLQHAVRSETVVAFVRWIAEAWGVGA